MDKTFTVQRFLGLHESQDGATQLKMGEASEMDNFVITMDGHLRLRPAAKDLVKAKAPWPPGSDNTWLDGWKIIGFYAGPFGGRNVLVLAKAKRAGYYSSAVEVYGENMELLYQKMVVDGEPVFGLTVDKVNIFNFGDAVWFVANDTNSEYGHFLKLTRSGDTFSLVTPELYAPLVVTGAFPEGGGDNLEPYNGLYPYARFQYSADGTSTAYALPNGVRSVSWVKVDNAPLPASGYTVGGGKIIFKTAPEKGVNNVELMASVSGTIVSGEISRCRFAELYNGATDNRVFYYGNGTNRCYYSAVRESGEADPLYVPAINEIMVGDDAPITAMMRHYNKLLCFKPTSTYSITYEPVTLTDGTTIGGFYLRSLHRELGNAAPGQVTLIDNHPRAIMPGAVYDWVVTNSYYRDERNAKRISDRVCRTAAAIDPAKAVCVDDNETFTWFCFLNDDKGTVLCHNYAADAWCIWHGEAFRNVIYAASLNGKMVFARADSLLAEDTASDMLSVLDFTDTEDRIEHLDRTEQIKALWASGYMDFGSDTIRKYSSYIWVSLLPQEGSEITITANTDRRNQYMEKVTGVKLLNWSAVDFRQFTFNRAANPKIKRVKLKVKKFVYYRLIFRVEEAGARAAILGFDQQVRYSSLAK